ncbi:hypothetical protein HYPSUDRAFT_68540 [Hypholoma sublateritium FD-334 SS-4]|uniref:Uncharacterized protein n=1 Tax=Hypholoma sublateritium (strain FD-334 SS-4) TaxID=945553 RepID=A0A0D2NNB9_HYPSF|nr:hypothetical protein HYPSUDRAFT_68540 [Hypholoma sublateritium FD-334 SS-4]
MPTYSYSQCEQGTFGSGNDSYFFCRCPTTVLNKQWVLADLNINVDFSLLGNISHLYTRPQLPLVIGLSNNTIDDYTHTVPVTFIPGVNMAAPYILGIRQVYTNGVLAALGIFEATKTFLLPNIIAFYPDPTATFTGSNRSSLNIFSQANYGEVPFVQDNQEKSVIAGFSSVGGLWTAFSGIFAILFGASMLHIFYGSKPLSIFGVAHRFQAEAMKKDCLARYPQILKENCSPEQRGLLSLIRDHLINLEFMDDEKDSPSSSVDQDPATDVERPLVAAGRVPDQIELNTIQISETEDRWTI